MKPMNRHIKIALMDQSPADEAGGVLMPDGYAPTQEWQSATIVDVADTCESFDIADSGSVVVFPGNMLLAVETMEQKFHFVQENYVVCKMKVL